MDKYIDAHEADKVLNDLFDDIDDYVFEESKSEQYANGFADGVSAAIDKLDTFIPADVEPVRHGHWGQVDDLELFYCSECFEVQSNMTSYCPHCGAKMDGEDGEDE